MTEEELLLGNQFIIDNMLWSFSRLNSFYNCPYEWHEKYIMCQYGERGFFGEFGGCCHKILERYAKGELSIFEISQAYEEEFATTVVHDAPPNKYVDIKSSYFEKGLDYFDNIDLDLEKYEVLGVEKEVRFKIADKDFIGFIDLLLREKDTGKIIILDHKSASIKFLKNGNVSKTDQAHVREFIRQLCLYSIPVIEEYGRVDELWWNLFKDRNWLKIPWKQEDQDEAVQWAKDTIALIEKETEYPCKQDFYYCWNLCSQRNNACPYKPQIVSKKEDDGYYNPETEQFEH